MPLLVFRALCLVILLKGSSLAKLVGPASLHGAWVCQWVTFCIFLESSSKLQNPTQDLSTAATWLLASSCKVPISNQDLSPTATQLLASLSKLPNPTQDLSPTATRLLTSSCKVPIPTQYLSPTATWLLESSVKLPMPAASWHGLPWKSCSQFQ